MRTYQINDKYSSADIGIDVTADSLEELFIAAGEGYTAIAIATGGDRDTREIDIELSADSAEQLLVDWLSELIYLFDTEGVIFTESKMRISTGEDRAMTLSASMRGILFDKEFDTARYDVKAVTYYKLAIKEKDGMFSCHVVFDL